MNRYNVYVCNVILCGAHNIAVDKMHHNCVNKC